MDNSLSYLVWLASTVEPSLLGDQIISIFEDHDVFHAYSVGRVQRYTALKSKLMKRLDGVKDVVCIVLDFDGFENGKECTVFY